MQTYTLENTECLEWFERDRANVRLLVSEDAECPMTELLGGTEIICLWDSEVSEFVEDGFKSRSQTWHEALVEYANTHRLVPSF